MASPPQLLYPSPGLSGAPNPRSGTVGDLLAIPEGDRHHEIVDGEIVRKAAPSLRHGTALAELLSLLAGAYGLRSRGRGPGGWVLASVVEILFDAANVHRPDVLGWHRARLFNLPGVEPVALRPDWVCEILSPSHPQNDLIKKMRVYHRFQVPCYWILDPMAETLAVYRWTAEGYLLTQTAQGRERIKAEPFAGVEWSLRGLLEEEAR